MFYPYYALTDNDMVTRHTWQPGFPIHELDGHQERLYSEVPITESPSLALTKDSACSSSTMNSTITNDIEFEF
jgi:hypothetical protein